MKTYTKNQVTYGFSHEGRTWKFSGKNFTFLLECKGKAQADKVATAVSASLTRSEKRNEDVRCLDGLAHFTVDKIVAQPKREVQCILINKESVLPV